MELFGETRKTQSLGKSENIKISSISLFYIFFLNYRTFYSEYLFAAGNSQKMFMNFLADTKGFLSVGDQVCIHLGKLWAG